MIEHPQQSELGPRSGRNLAQILVILIVLLVLVNVPLNAAGFGLAQLKPEASPLTISEGMLFQAPGSPDLYLLENHRLRRIGSPEVQRRYFSSRKVHVVEAEVLAQFSRGRPIYHLIRCLDSPQVYALEKGQKRLVTADLLPDSTGPWDQVRPVSCSFLAGLPDGAPIIEE
ncbi:MAG: hypothetical protein KDF65_00070 [Anaerolineae bacterium]|nr:hypothetical protein [Anaerolineae bacterium]